MNNSIFALKDLSQRMELHSEAFSVYSPTFEQNLLNVPIIKPVLIIVCSGEKALESKSKNATCFTNQFVFISGSNSIGMRNIPKNDSYHAILIEFEDDELPIMDKIENRDDVDFFIGDIDSVLNSAISQFMEISSVYPYEIIKLRRKEIVSIILSKGYNEIKSIKRTNKLTEKISKTIKNSDLFNTNIQYLSSLMGMSESTIHRKLKEENTSIKEIKDRVRMGRALHLLQTTDLSIGLISERCGYKTHSKFSIRFKKHFGITPAELKKTR